MNDLLKGTNLYLIGMMGAGKTTVGRILAKELGYYFFDTDAVVEQAAGQTISDIFAQSGETAFRQLETEVLGRLATHTKLAIATGGGIVLDRKNWSYLHHGVVVWLDVPIAQLFHRLKGNQDRPLLKDPNPQEKLQAIFDQRRSLYAQADIRVAVERGDTPEQVAIRVLEALRQSVKPSQPPSASVFDAN